ncbi:MAG: S-methyl-5-thioribose-1-phosphate isomerase [Lentisphaeria bacterium]|nr:S-methyl-5-thioribose-1-phosphate isomerase [Lentisphaeria bacterium]
MNVNGKQYRTIWLDPDQPDVVRIIDQRALPHEFTIMDLRTVEDVRRAIADMAVRGAGLIGATAAYGMYIAALTAPETTFEASLRASAATLIATRPTAANLAWAVNRQLAAMETAADPADKIAIARQTAAAVADEDTDFCRRIGLHGHPLIQAISAKKNGAPVNILTHCNAGWLAFVDYGSATAPMYAARAAGVPIHVWVDETRPRNQGASLTAWELGQHGISHELIVDNAGGHLMQHGLVDMCIVGADRVTRRGDAANKIGTYLKALAARDNGIPFYIALPSSTFDFAMRDGIVEIPVEERDPEEVRTMTGRDTRTGQPATIRICPDTTPARNVGFDVTPARLITALITERGVCAADEVSILSLYPEAARITADHP